jgi:DNA-binding NarL/FixJ family response regulator
MIRVFIADDHAIIRDGLVMLLQAQKDIRVVGTASDGLGAVKSIETIKPDIVLMDISMPRLNGIEAVERLTKTCRNTRFIMLSMHANSEYVSRAVKAGAWGYLLKESAGQDVIKAVRQIHSGIRYFSPKVSNEFMECYINDKTDRQSHPSLDQLSFRERETLQLVVEGKSSVEIAELLFLSPKTIETYRSRIMEKLNIHDIPGLVKFAIKHGMITLDR